MEEYQEELPSSLLIMFLVRSKLCYIRFVMEQLRLQMI